LAQFRILWILRRHRSIVWIPFGRLSHSST
jgi:hypothetical protein